MAAFENGILTFAIAATALVVARSFLQRLRRGPSACQSCGYSLVGITSLRCPECGHDISRQVRPSRSHATARSTAWLTASAALAATILYVAYWLAESYVMSVRTDWTYHGRMACQANSTHASIEILGTAVDWRPHRDGAVLQPEPTRMVFRAAAANDTHGLVLVRDAPDSAWKVPNGASSASDQPPAVLKSWMEKVYPDLDADARTRMVVMSQSFLDLDWTNGGLETFCNREQMRPRSGELFTCIPQLVGIDSQDTSSEHIRRAVRATLALAVLASALVFWRRETKRQLVTE